MFETFINILIKYVFYYRENIKVYDIQYIVLFVLEHQYIVFV